MKNIQFDYFYIATLGSAFVCFANANRLWLSQASQAHSGGDWCSGNETASQAVSLTTPSAKFAARWTEERDGTGSLAGVRCR